MAFEVNFLLSKFLGFHLSDFENSIGVNELGDDNIYQYLRDINVALWGAMAVPKAGYETLRTYIDWLNWVFIFDDSESPYISSSTRNLQNLCLLTDLLRVRHWEHGQRSDHGQRIAGEPSC